MDSDGRKYCIMKKMFHLCISSSDEVMFRCQEDYLRAFNYFALASYSTGTLLLCDAIMSNHIHSCVISSRLEEMAAEFKYSYSRYFNSRYHRRGGLGEKKPFVLEVEGAHHILAALSYTLRNPYHHGIASTPFGYEHSSANIFFQKELGKQNQSTSCFRAGSVSRPTSNLIPEGCSLGRVLWRYHRWSLCTGRPETFFFI